MINLTEQQIEILKNNGYQQVLNYDWGQNYPWYKKLTSNSNIDIEIIINPLYDDRNVIFGFCGEDEAEDNYFCIEGYADAKDILEELITLKSFEIW